MTGPIWTEEETFLAAERGHALFLQGRYEEATIIFEGLMAMDPANVYCANALSALYIRHGQVARAVELLDGIVEIYPNDGDTRARRCEALLLIGRVADARKDWEILRRSSKTEFVRLEMLLQLAQTRTAAGKQLSGAKFDK